MHYLKKYIAFIVIILFAKSLLIADSDSLNSKKEPSFVMLPFAFYNASIDWAFGGFVGYKGFAQEQTLLKAGGIVSTLGTYYGYLQLEEFQFPFFPRLFFRPDLYAGKVKNVKSYAVAKSPDDPPAGSNDSRADSYIVMDGTDQWYEFTLKYLLPIGDGKNPFTNYKFDKGILISGETGAHNFINPIKSGRTFINVKAFYRNNNLETDNGVKLKPVTFGLEYGLTWENMDYFFNPTCGNYFKFALLDDWGALGSNSEFSAWKADLRWYIPVYDKESGEAPRVLALNFYTMDTPSWYDIKSRTTLQDGSEYIEYKRPQFFAGVNLGGFKKLRGFINFRYFDKAMIYYSAELRQNLKWNPMEYWDFTRKIGIDFFQVVAFADVGRVAPEWKLSTLHKDLQWSVGGGIRFFMDGIVIRVDVGKGAESTEIQMFVDHPF